MNKTMCICSKCGKWAPLWATLRGWHYCQSCWQVQQRKISAIRGVDKPQGSKK